jgi:predicted nucleic acid-binding protein
VGSKEAPPGHLRPRLFFDANVVFSACVTQSGRAAPLVQLARGGLCHLLTSPHALHEARRNLALRYPGHEDRLEFILRTVAVVPEAHATLVSWAREQGLPDEDTPILAAAVQAEADALVTGDRTHFGPLFGRILKGVRIVALSEALTLVGFKP